MHSALIVIAFVAMLLSPCAVTIFRSDEDKA
jgi:hypothetical protein